MMPIWLNFAELFDVDVDQLAGMLALVASHRLGRLKRAEPVETPADEGCGSPSPARWQAAWRSARRCGAAVVKPQRLRVWQAGFGLAMKGREERSRRPSMPSSRKRSTHLATVFGVML
jgi:hypothetical protein